MYTVGMNISEQVYYTLLSLFEEPRHGYDIIGRAEDLSGGRVKLSAGTLYGALDRLESNGAVVLDREEIVNGRLRRFYRLTDSGAALLDTETERMRQATIAFKKVHRKATIDTNAKAAIA